MKITRTRKKLNYMVICSIDSPIKNQCKKRELLNIRMYSPKPHGPKMLSLHFASFFRFKKGSSYGCRSSTGPNEEISGYFWNKKILKGYFVITGNKLCTPT